MPTTAKYRLKGQPHQLDSIRRPVLPGEWFYGAANNKKAASTVEAAA